jgi:hypothetical protein
MLLEWAHTLALTLRLGLGLITHLDQAAEAAVVESRLPTPLVTAVQAAEDLECFWILLPLVVRLAQQARLEPQQAQQESEMLALAAAQDLLVMVVQVD